jgi:phosphohistidine phosphatase
MKTLYLLRHAKAESGSATVGDEDRPLSARGREACKRIGGYMMAKAYTPAMALCSTSARTRETLELVAESHSGKLSYALEKKLYLATADEMLEQIHTADDTYASLMVVGHNPGMHHLAALLASAEYTPLRTILEIKYPTGALAVLTFDVKRWSDVTQGGGELKDFVIPSEL